MVDDPLRERTEGRARTGFVNLRSFDEGVVETLGAVVVEEECCSFTNYFLMMKPVETVGFDPSPEVHFYRGATEPRPGLPGVPVTFAIPEDVFEKYSIPLILVRREGLDPALQRWHPGTLQYRAPGRGALPANYQATPLSTSQSGYDRYEQVEQAAPFDLSYTITVVARNRGMTKDANRLLDHILRIYQPYCEVRVRDSIGDIRGYEAFMEGTSQVDEVADVTDRVIGFAVSLRIEGELDLSDPVVRKAVTQRSTSLRENG